VRWQLSTPILAFCVVWFKGMGSLEATMLANLIGGLIFFWVDHLIFSGHINEPLWVVKEDVKCADCGVVARGYRLIYTTNYDRRRDSVIKFRCESCSAKKTEKLRENGIDV